MSILGINNLSPPEATFTEDNNANLVRGFENSMAVYLW